jgi:hypothetical protein
MGESEVFQTRLYDDRAEVIHDYIEDRNISKAEATRRFIHWGMDNMPTEEGEGNAEPDATREQEDRIQILARLLERVSLAGWISFTAGTTFIILAALAIETFALTVGTFGLLLLFGVTLFLWAIGTVGAIAAFLGLVYLEWKYDAVSDLLGKYLGGAVRYAVPSEATA